MAAPQKVGVLTFHRCINYGSYWQARCLVEGLRGRGLDAVLLDHRSTRVDRAEWRCALSPHLPAPTRPRQRAAYARKTRAFLAAIEALPLSRPFSLEAPETVEDCDLVVVGSDEVWNRRHPWYGSAGLFYGCSLRARRLAAYAASFGNHAACDGLDTGLAERLRRFDAISVRDDNSRRLVRDCVGWEPELVLDPCLQFPEALPRTPRDGTTDVAVVYGHSFPDWFARGVRRWARGRGLRLVSLGYHADWADEERLDASPEDFSRSIAEAEAVATTFFHGCVFALVHGKAFACAASPYRSNKLQSLVATLAAEERLLSAASGPADYHAALDAPPDERLAGRIAALRSRSAAYLDHVLH
jgi:Polysaccharide pyruvyl transferase